MRGIALLHKSKVDPQGLASFFKKMKVAFKGKGEGPEWMSSHPGTENRIKAVEDYNNANPCINCETLIWDKKGILASLAKEKSKT